MMKPNFEDFLNTLSPELIESLIEELPEDLKKYNFVKIGTYMPTISLSLSIKLLNLYHEWLFEQIEKEFQDLNQFD